MARVRLQPTITAGWHELVVDAQEIYGHTLSDDLEHYLIILLQRYTDRPEVLASVLAMEYLHALEEKGGWQQDSLREVGDKCLLFSGLFPEQADKKRVSINYFIDLGKSSYYGVASGISHHSKLAQLYVKLEQHFVGMMDVLHVIREMSGIEHQLQLQHAIELWGHTQSEYARIVIERHTQWCHKKSNLAPCGSIRAKLIK